MAALKRPVHREISRRPCAPRNGAFALRLILPCALSIAPSLAACAPAHDHRPAEILRLGTDDDASPSDDRTMLRVLTWNVHGRAQAGEQAHLRRVAETLQKLEADVSMLQEVHRATPLSRGRDQLVELMEATGNDACFARTRSLGTGDYGLAVLSRLEIVEAESIVLPGRGEPRTVLRCRLRRPSGQVLDVYTLHLSAWGVLNARRRGRQLARALEVIADGNTPIVGGDFNAGLDADELRALADARLVPTLDSGVATYRGWGGQSYDHLLVSPQLEICSSHVERAGPSDHWPVLARLSLIDHGDAND